MTEFKLNKDKAIHSLLYVCQKLGGQWGMYSLLKILYFAECKHLVKYGRPITGDKMIAMQFGPVPSFSYNEIKAGSIDKKFFDHEDDIISCKITPNLDWLSESDIECLDQSIEENARLSFGELKSKSHNTAYESTIASTGKNSVISYLEIAKAEGAKDNILKYIALNIENNFAHLK